MAITWFTADWDYPRSYGEVASGANSRTYRFNGHSAGDYQALFEKWNMSGVEYFDPLRAMTLKMGSVKRDFGLDKVNPYHTPYATADNWVEGRWATFAGVKYLKYQVPDPRKFGGVRTIGNFDLDAGVKVFVINHPQAANYLDDGSMVFCPDIDRQPPWAEIRLPPVVGKWDGVRYLYSIGFPTFTGIEEVDTVRRPIIRRATCDINAIPTSAWLTVSEYGAYQLHDALMRSQRNSMIFEEAIWIRIVEGRLMVSSGLMGDWWVIEDPVFDDKIVAGQLQLWSYGHVSTWNVAQMYCASKTGTLTLKTNPDVPDDVIDMTGWRVQQDAAEGGLRNGAYVTPNYTYSTGDDGFFDIDSVGATLGSQDGLHAPFLYALYEKFEPTFNTQAASPTSLPIFSATIDRRVSDRGHIRGGTCRLVLDPSETQPQWKGNEVVTIKAGTWVNSGGWARDSGYTVFTGRVSAIERPSQKVTGRVLEPNTWMLTDESWRLEGEKCLNKIHDCRGKHFVKAWRESLNAFGVPNAKIKIDGAAWTQEIEDADTFVLSEEKTHTKSSSRAGLAPTPQSSAVQWLDFLCERRGDWIWEVCVDGTIDVCSNENQSLTPVFTLRSSPASTDDVVEEVREARGLDAYVNEVYVLSRDPVLYADKAEIRAKYRDRDSTSDPTKYNYIGARRTEIRVDSGIEHPEVYVRSVADKAKKSLDQLSFSFPQGKAIFCGNIVKSLLAGMDVFLTGSLISITSEKRELRAEQEGVRHTCSYTGCMHTRGAGTEAAE